MGVQLDTGKDGKGAKPNINVTPLVDVVLVLLIIFMVVIPNMQEGKPIEMVSVETIENPEDNPEFEVVTMQLNGTIYLGDEALLRDALIAKLAKLHAADPDKKLLLRADSRLPYEDVRGVFFEAQQMGFKQVSLAVGKQKEWNVEEGSVG